VTDLSALVGWPPLVVGFAVSIWAGRSMRGPRSFGRFLGAGFMAFMLGVLLTLATAGLHTSCVEQMHLCQSHGDGNMSYWFHSLLAVPLFWAAMLAFGSSANTVLAQSRSLGESVTRALDQFRLRQNITESCPACASVLLVEQVLTSAGSRTVKVSCSCGQCSGKYQIRDNAA